MLKKLRGQYKPWVWAAAIAMIATWIFVASWNFSHAYILAGGENPLLILEGRWPGLNGGALGVALVSLACDTIKAIGGFMIVGAFAYAGWRRAVVLACALVLVVPTFFWSVRSAAGMVSLVFGDTIAGRANDQLITNSLREQISKDQDRFSRLSGMTSSNRKVERELRSEAAELRKELDKQRKELRSAKGIGGADPGAHVIAQITGIDEAKISNYTIILFVGMVEIITTLGLPVLGAVAKTPTPPAVPAQEAKGSEKTRKDDEDDLDPDNLNGHKGKFEVEDGRLGFTLSPHVSDPAEMAQQESEYYIVQAEVVNDDEKEKLALKPVNNRRGRPKKARISDGHVEDYKGTLQGEKPGRDSYVQYCKERYLEPMSTQEMWNGLRNRARLARGIIERYMEGPSQGRA